VTRGPQASFRRSSVGGVLRALVFCAALLTPLPASSADLVFVLETGEVLAEEAADQLWHPASLTKMMTAYVVFQELATGRLALTQEIVASDAAATQPATSLGFGSGRTLTVEEALLGLILRSGNDAAVALAEAVAGSETAFVEQMNRASARLGLASTVFRNASGLPNDAQVTTARDLALLTRALILEFPQYYWLFGQRGFDFKGDWRTNINGILGSLPGADGLKTGFTCKSGYNLVVSALRDGRRVVAVILGASSPDQRSARGRALVEAAFAALALPDREPGLALAAAPPSIAAAAAEASAPTILDGGQCGYGTVARLPGHGVKLGAFVSRGKALSVADAAKERYADFQEAGTAAVPSRRGAKFNAVLVGLSQSEAKSGCRAVRKAGGYCLVLTPQVLNNPRAVWR